MNPNTFVLYEDGGERQPGSEPEICNGSSLDDLMQNALNLMQGLISANLVSETNEENQNSHLNDYFPDNCYNNNNNRGSGSPCQSSINVRSNNDDFTKVDNPPEISPAELLFEILKKANLLPHDMTSLSSSCTPVSTQFSHASSLVNLPDQVFDRMQQTVALVQQTQNYVQQTFQELQAAFVQAQPALELLAQVQQMQQQLQPQALGNALSECSVTPTITTDASNEFFSSSSSPSASSCSTSSSNSSSSAEQVVLSSSELEQGLPSKRRKRQTVGGATVYCRRKLQKEITLPNITHEPRMYDRKSDDGGSSYSIKRKRKLLLDPEQKKMILAELKKKTLEERTEIFGSRFRFHGASGPTARRIWTKQADIENDRILSSGGRTKLPDSKLKEIFLDANEKFDRGVGYSPKELRKIVQDAAYDYAKEHFRNGNIDGDNSDDNSDSNNSDNANSGNISSSSGGSDSSSGSSGSGGGDSSSGSSGSSGSSDLNCSSDNGSSSSSSKLKLPCSRTIDNYIAVLKQMGIKLLPRLKYRDMKRLVVRPSFKSAIFKNAESALLSHRNVPEDLNLNIDPITLVYGYVDEKMGSSSVSCGGSSSSSSVGLHGSNSLCAAVIPVPMSYENLVCLLNNNSDTNSHHNNQYIPVCLPYQLTILPLANFSGTLGPLVIVYQVTKQDMLGKQASSSSNIIKVPLYGCHPSGTCGNFQTHIWFVSETPSASIIKEYLNECLPAFLRQCKNVISKFKKIDDRAVLWVDCYGDLTNFLSSSEGIVWTNENELCVNMHGSRYTPGGGQQVDLLPVFGGLKQAVRCEKYPFVPPSTMLIKSLEDGIRGKVRLGDGKAPLLSLLAQLASIVPKLFRLEDLKKNFVLLSMKPNLAACMCLCDDDIRQRLLRTQTSHSSSIADESALDPDSCTVQPGANVAVKRRVQKARLAQVEELFDAAEEQLKTPSINSKCSYCFCGSDKQTRMIECHAKRECPGNHWYHLECVRMNVEDANMFESSGRGWTCLMCRGVDR